MQARRGADPAARVGQSGAAVGSTPHAGRIGLGETGEQSPDAGPSPEGEEAQVAPELCGASPGGTAPLGAAWQKWLVGAAAGCVLGAVAFGVVRWMGRGADRPAALPQSAVPSAGPLVVEPTGPVEAPSDEPFEALPPWLDGRWFPHDLKLLLGMRIAAVARQSGFDGVLAYAGPYWEPAFQRVLDSFGLKREAVRGMGWAAVDLADWPDQAVVIIELGKGQDAGVFARAGRPVDLRLDGQPCFRLRNSRWPHPFAVIGPQVLVTGPEKLLRELDDQAAGGAAKGRGNDTMQQLMDSVTAADDLVFLVDAEAARRAGWEGPTRWGELWPEAREPWQVVWQTPTGYGIYCRSSGDWIVEVALACDGQTAASQLHSALDRLVPVARELIRAELGGPAKGAKADGDGMERLDREGAQGHEWALRQLQAMLDAAHWEQHDTVVRVRVNGSESMLALAEGLLGCGPALERAWLEAALRADCQRHRRLISGVLDYHTAEGRFPPGAGQAALLAPETQLSWIAALLPYYGHEDWYEQLDFGYGWNGPPNRPVVRRRLEAVVNPAVAERSTEAGFPVTHYVGVAGVGEDAGNLPGGHPRAGVFGFRRAMRLDEITDGASNTIAILGVSGRLGPWAAGGQATVRGLTARPYFQGPDGFGSGQPSGMLAAMADGSVRFLSSQVDPAVLEQLATAAGGESIQLADRATRLLVDGSGKSLCPPVPQPADAERTRAPVAEPEDWQTALVEAGTASEPVGAELQERLGQPLRSIVFSDTPLRRAVETWGQLSGLAVTIDVEALRESGVGLADPIRLELKETTLGEVLQRVLAARGLTCVVQKGQILVTTPMRVDDRLRQVSYAVSDLAAGEPGGMAALAELIQRVVVPESWQAAGGPGTIVVKGPALVVTQTDAVHYRVLEFCEKLRVARGLPLRSRLEPERFTLATHLQRARAKLERPVSANFHDPVPVARILEYLEQVGGMTILVDRLALGEDDMLLQVEATLKVTEEPLRDALAKVLWPLGLAARVIDETTLQVTTRHAVASRLELEFYPIRDLLTGTMTAEAVIEQIKGGVAGDTWSDAGGPGVIHFDRPSGCLLVLQSQPVQAEVDQLLRRLRASPPAPSP
ncbi:MAG TPA: DUF1559 domain-containing protein [Planctomycetaceae bacterium]|nr:DUF1559 domain-containing protein [Planctomycetaceae bacterium]